MRALLIFWHAYNLERGFDGGVIELSTNGGTTWIDLGTLMITNGYSSYSVYNETISTGFGSPIGGRRAFSGDSAGYVEERGLILSSFAGQSVLLRFDNASDRSLLRVGWTMDNVRVASSTPWIALGT